MFWAEALLVLCVGASFGSFITLASYRLPRGEDIVRKSSRCPQCDTTLKIPDLIPVLSWAALRGKCRHCKAPVHWRYPLIELVTGALFLLVWQRHGLTLEAALLGALTVGLMIMIVADFEHYIIPDEVHYILIPTAIAYRYVMGDGSMEVLPGFIVGLGAGMLLRYGFQWLRKKEGLGMGDVKFLADVGLWVPILTLVPFLFFSGLLGVATAVLWRVLARGEYYPFGPALAMALFICVVYPEVPQFFWEWQHYSF